MSKKRQLLIDTALTLFYNHGIHAIGVNEILKRSGVAKRTLYSHFNSKEELLLAALEARHRLFIQWLESKLSNAKNDLEVTTVLFQALENWFDNNEPRLGEFRGCFFINTCGEYSDVSCEIRKLCEQHKSKVRQVIADKLSIDNQDNVAALCILMEGAIVTAQVSGKNTLLIEDCINASQAMLR
ncbi:TetR/AcrR family transcriptional regulator [Pseudoalteromonas sp. JBTF-M23]|uniref:TetR/AcrR family transcriptional regulator n=1 Tax=Pseudoalteromonas caenipelagi TaxID=2726988 RepID=A0A849V8P6_9GAMM|nr:TetR/AcrR family transcriptional regulator [Pseudoalteromonas caenipelagi]NOU49245.1 TetR/AcrR family transcriptional regulator [Pseudoalteromonas caenipelagi]